jgi:TonB-linked SusC/RagA family outer membrane protein
MNKMFTASFRSRQWLVLLVAYLVFSSKLLLAQSITVTGTVTNENNESLPGVNIAVKGSTEGTTTDVNGKYVLNVPDGNATLTFSFIGYASEDVTINNRTQIDLSMLPDITTLDEIVVVGYGTQQRTNVTGAIASMRGKSLRELPVTTVEQALNGRLAGVQVQQASGQPGAGISIRVRGASSIAGGNEPLYVIDGLPQYNDDVRNANGMASINPDDIESVEVLKDASATAIYGSRGANGVVMLTTKTGKAGQPRVVFESSLSFQKVRKKLDLMNAEEYIAYSREFYTNTGSSVVMPADLQSYSGTVDTDWQNEVFRTAPMSNSNLSVSGGTDRNRYYISAGYLDQKGIVLNTGYTRGSIRINLDNKLSDRVNIQSRITTSRAIQNGFSAAQGDNTRNFGKAGIGSILRSVPTAPVRDENGKYTDSTPFTFNGIDAENPVALAMEALDQNTITRIQGGVDVKVEVLKGLTNTTRIGGDFTDTRRDLYFPRILPRLGNNIGAAELGLYDKSSMVLEDFLEYKYELSSDTYLEGIAGMSMQKDRYNAIDISASGFGSDDMKNYNISAANSVNKPITDVQQSAILSSFGRVRFNHQEKYLIAASIRRDGASVFAPNNKYGVFPSVSAGWRISEEAFLKTVSTISSLKLRASWGQSGNPAIKPYQSMSLGRTINTGQGAGTGLNVGIAPTLENPNLKWETTTQTNIGIDAGILDDKFRLTLDYYVKATSDLLALIQLPPSAGVGAHIGSGPGQMIDNVGEVQNKGWEITLGANVLNTTDWSLTVDANLTHNRNRVTKTLNGKDVPAISGATDASGSRSIIRPGEPLSAFYGFKFISLGDDGLPIYENVDGNVDGAGKPIYNSLDHVIIGSPYPDFYYGLNTLLKYKRLSFSTTWSGVSGSSLINMALFDLTTPTPSGAYNKLSAARDFYPIPSQSASNLHVVGGAISITSRYIEDADYFRLRNIRFDYSFRLPATFVIKNLNMYISGQNLLTFTNYSGFDPEVNSFNGNDRRQGVDLGAYPTAKTYTLGFSLTL